MQFRPDITPLILPTIQSQPNFGEIDPQANDFLVSDVSQTDLSVFFSQYEDDPSIPPEVLEAYLTNPTLMALQVAIIQDLLDHYESGAAPLSPEDFYVLTLDRVGDPGTALLVGHNTLKAMARGTSSIPWEKISEFPLVYNLGGTRIELDPVQKHPSTQLTGSRGQQSIFYQIFPPSALGTSDEGDWYHYFLEATVAYFTATGRSSQDPPGFGISYSSVLGRAVDGMVQQMHDPATPDSDPYRAWRWANALSFLEQAKHGTDYGGNQEEAERESRIHMRGAIFGLELAGYSPDWEWTIAEIGSAGLTGVDVPSSISETIYPWDDVDERNP